MNSQIKDKNLTTQSDDDTKKHQAFAMELSRLKKAKVICDESKNCSEFNTLGGQARIIQIEPLVKQTQVINHNKKKVGMEAGLENQFQKKKNGTEVGIAMVTKSSDHSGKSTTNDIMTNDQALQPKEVKDKILSNAQGLSEEILEIRYLIEYMNNNNKQIL
jgi:hypothetical protein